MQALSAIMLLYREVLDRPVSDLRRVLRSTSPTRLPPVLCRDEVRAALAEAIRSHKAAYLMAVGGAAHLVSKTIRS